jgi:hypothetical protein
MAVRYYIIICVNQQDLENESYSASVRLWGVGSLGVHVGPQIGMNPKPILGLPFWKPIPFRYYGIAFLAFFSVTHKIGLFSQSDCAALPLPLPLPPLLLLLLPPPQAATPAPPPLPLIRRRVVFSSRRVLLHPVC